MEEPKGVDKRSKQYREYKAWKKEFDKQQAKKPEGLGDVVKTITKATGIDKLVKFIAGEDCGCAERQKELNRMFHFGKPKCLEEQEFNYLATLFNKKVYNVTPTQRNMLYDIYNRVFGTKLEPTNCPSCVANVVKKLEVIYKTYK